MGGGITGALVAWYLAQAGVSVVLLDRRHIGMGSTCASTSMLQYEIDTPLSELAQLVGEGQEQPAVIGFARRRLMRVAISVNTVFPTDFKKKPSLYYASRGRHVKALEQEFAIRQKHGFDLALLDKSAVERLFRFAAPAACPGRVVEVDAYALTHGFRRPSRRAYGCLTKPK